MSILLHIHGDIYIKARAITTNPLTDIHMAEVMQNNDGNKYHRVKRNVLSIIFRTCANTVGDVFIMLCKQNLGYTHICIGVICKRRGLAPSIVSLTGNWDRGDDNKHGGDYSYKNSSGYLEHGEARGM